MNILIVKLSSLGDVVQTLPVVHDLRMACPGVAVDWAVEEAFQDLVRRAPGVRRVVPVAQRRWRKTPFAAATRQEVRAARQRLREQAYDVVLDGQGLVKSALVARQARLAEGGYTAGFGNRSELCSWEWPVRWMVDRPIEMPQRIHAVARTRLLAARALGYDTPGFLDTPPVYPWPAGVQLAPPSVLLAHGTTRADNEWPEQDWTGLARRLVAGGFEVLLPQSSPAEQQLAERIAAAVPDGVRVLPGMGLAELLDTLSRCCGLIGVDSGVSHMGVALDLPVVQVFSQPRVWRAGPLGREHQRAVGGDAAPDLDAVWTAWQACWDRRPPRDGEPAA